MTYAAYFNYENKDLRSRAVTNSWVDCIDSPIETCCNTLILNFVKDEILIEWTHTTNSS